MTFALKSGATAAAVLAVALAPGCSSAQNACDRNCLDGFAERYLESLVANDASILEMSDDVRFTEDGVEMAPGEGLWTSATGLRQHRLNVLDDEWDTAAGLAILDEGGQAALLSYRLKIEDMEVNEIETMVVHDSEETNYAERETLQTMREEFLVEIPASERESREEIIRIADFYPAGLKAGSFVDVDAPFAEGARRLENGMVLAGPDCTFNENCRNMKTQPSPERPTLRQRLLAVDEEQGIAFYWLDWVQSATGRTLEVYEAFKVYDGQIQAVEAFIKNDDPENYPGWD